MRLCFFPDGLGTYTTKHYRIGEGKGGGYIHTYINIRAYMYPKKWGFFSSRLPRMYNLVYLEKEKNLDIYI